jgi:Sec-independent protein translocase protein TatA
VDLGILLVIILIVVFVWRGPKTLPDLGRTFGEGLRAIRHEAQKATDDHPDTQAGDEPGPNGR